jgi:hypothetical protein
MTEDFIGPQLPPDDILYRRRPMLSKEVFRHRRKVLQDWLRPKLEEQPARYGNEENYYVILGDSGQFVTVKEYLDIRYGRI